MIWDNIASSHCQITYPVWYHKRHMATRHVPVESTPWCRCPQMRMSWARLTRKSILHVIILNWAPVNRWKIMYSVIAVFGRTKLTFIRHYRLQPHFLLAFTTKRRMQSRLCQDDYQQRNKIKHKVDRCSSRHIFITVFISNRLLFHP